MQGCVSENKLIRLTAGELPAVEREHVLNHLQSCPQCRELWNGLRATWEILGQIADTPPEKDLTGAVLARAAVMRSRHTRWMAVAHVAAVVILAAGLGIAAGRLGSAGSENAVTARPVSDEQVIEALGLDAMDAGTRLLAGIFEPDDIGPVSDQELSL